MVIFSHFFTKHSLVTRVMNSMGEGKLLMFTQFSNDKPCLSSTFTAHFFVALGLSDNPLLVSGGVPSLQCSLFWLVNFVFFILALFDLLYRYISYETDR